MVMLFITGAILVFQKDIVSSAAQGGWVSSIGWDNPEPFFKTVKQLHRWILDSPPGKTALSVGRAIIGISTIATTLVLISGIVIWVPRSYKALKNRLKITSGKGVRRFFYDWHMAIGIYTVLFLLLMTLTGPTWTFPWYKSAFLALVPGGSQSLIYTIHTGGWGGIVVKLIYFFSSLAGATLTVTGYYLWLKKKLAK